jgi:hypothetical protein
MVQTLSGFEVASRIDFDYGVTAAVLGKTPADTCCKRRLRLHSRRLQEYNEGEGDQCVYLAMVRLEAQISSGGIDATFCKQQETQVGGNKASHVGDGKPGHIANGDKLTAAMVQKPHVY